MKWLGMARFARLWTATSHIVGTSFGHADPAALSIAAGIPVDPPVTDATLCDGSWQGESPSPWWLYVHREGEREGQPTEIRVGDEQAHRVLRAGGFVPATLEDGGQFWLLDPRVSRHDQLQT